MTDIEWVRNADGGQGKTWNPIRGCTRVSPGCGGPGPHGGCYAERVAARFSGPGQPYEGLAEMRGGKPRWTGKLAFVESKLTEPLRTRKPTTWFVNSMSDLFHEDVPDSWIDRIFAVMALCPQHTFQVLTKRSGRMRAYVSDTSQRRCDGLGSAVIALDSTIPLETLRWPLPNVWLGVSAEDQRRADERIPDLLATPAAVRFVSAEPLLGPIDFRNVPYPSPPEDEGRRGCILTGHEVAGLVGNCIDWIPPLDWIIVGGESGPGARPMHPGWARSIRDQCKAAGVAFFFKQHGDWIDEALATAQGCAPGPEMFDVYGRPKGDRWHFYDPADRIGGAAIRVGKKAAGRLLDGRTHDGMPEVRA